MGLVGFDLLGIADAYTQLTLAPSLMVCEIMCLVWAKSIAYSMSRHRVTGLMLVFHRTVARA